MGIGVELKEAAQERVISEIDREISEAESAIRWLKNARWHDLLVNSCYKEAAKVCEGLGLYTDLQREDSYRRACDQDAARIDRIEKEIVRLERERRDAAYPPAKAKMGEPKFPIGSFVKAKHQNKEYGKVVEIFDVNGKGEKSYGIRFADSSHMVVSESKLEPA